MSTTKIDFRRQLRELYLPGRDPELVEVPEMAFLMVDGQGDPNQAPAYREAVEALYSVAYGVKFAIKRSPGGVDFPVLPLEGLWWSDDPDDFIFRRASRWQWTAMIMQPDPVTEDAVMTAIEQARSKRALPALEHLRYKRFAEGTAAQMMYVGPYADEGPAIKALHAFIAAGGRVITGKHHEIYLGDPRRTAPERLRTVIRQPAAPG